MLLACLWACLTRTIGFRGSRGAFEQLLPSLKGLATEQEAFTPEGCSSSGAIIFPTGLAMERPLGLCASSHSTQASPQVCAGLILRATASVCSSLDSPTTARGTRPDVLLSEVSSSKKQTLIIYGVIHYTSLYLTFHQVH